MEFIKNHKKLLIWLVVSVLLILSGYFGLWKNPNFYFSYSQNSNVSIFFNWILAILIFLSVILFPVALFSAIYFFVLYIKKPSN